MPWTEAGQRRHALARAGPEETCLAQSRARGGMPWPEPGTRRHALAGAGPMETCPGQSRARWVMLWPNPAPWPHASVEAEPVGTRPGQTRPRGSMPRPEASPGTRPLLTRRPHLRHAAPNPVAQPRKKTLSVGYLRKSTNVSEVVLQVALGNGKVGPFHCVLRYVSQCI